MALSGSKWRCCAAIYARDTSFIRSLFAGRYVVCTVTDDECPTDVHASPTVYSVSIQMYLSTQMQPRFEALKALNARTSTTLSPLAFTNSLAAREYR